MRRARSAKSGRFVPRWFARSHPDTTVEESVRSTISLEIVCDPQRVGGKPTIGHSRLTVGTVARYMRHAGIAATREAYPSLKLSEAVILSRLLHELDGPGST